MRPEINSKAFWDIYVYDWSGNKARKRRRLNIQKAKRANRRNAKNQIKIQYGLN